MYNKDKDNIKIPIDDEGRPTCFLSFRILRLLFSPPFPPPRPMYNTKEIASFLAADYHKTDTILKYFVDLDMLTEPPGHPGYYKYNMNCPNIELQAGFEKYLVEFEQNNLPVQLSFD